MYQEMLDHISAVRDFTQAIAIDPNYTEVYFYRGNSRVELQQYEKAIDDYEK